MAQIQVKANSARLANTAGRWLSILNASRQFKIDIPDNGTVIGAVGRQYDLTKISGVTFVNDSDQDLFVEYEMANIHITTVNDGNVKISNALSVKRIEQRVDVDAVIYSASRFISLDDIEIPARTKIKIVDADNLRAELFVKNSSANAASVRLGGESVGQRNGIEVRQNGVMSLTHGGAVYAYNPTDLTVKLSCSEVLQ